MPPEIINAYDLSPERTRKLGGGLVNLTFTAQTPSSQIVLQKLTPDTTADAMEDFAIYTKHLDDSGWEVPRIYPTADGDPYVFDNKSNLWRGMEYLEADEAAPASPRIKTLGQMGTLLARWHDTMENLDYNPQHQLPHFHNTDYCMTKLENLSDMLPGYDYQSLAEQTLEAYESIESLPQTRKQLVHGDPKLANMLFRNGQPFTLIDFDTVMHGSVWIDLGDMLRSVLKSNLSTGAYSAHAIIETISNNYLQRSKTGINSDEFTHNTNLATQHISLELLARYLSDIVEADYFTWDDERFSSRAENHLFNANLQWKVFNQLKNMEQ